MTSDIRRQVISSLAEIWDMSSDVRLGQLLAHLGFLGEAHFGRNLADMEDDELMAILQRHKAELQARLRGALDTTQSPRGSAVTVSGNTILLDTPSATEPSS